MNFSKEALLKVAKGAGIAAAGAILAYLTQYVTNTDLGQSGLVLGAILSVAVNALNQLKQENSNG